MVQQHLHYFKVKWEEEDHKQQGQQQIDRLNHGSSEMQAFSLSGTVDWIKSQKEPHSQLNAPGLQLRVWNSQTQNTFVPREAHDPYIAVCLETRKYLP